MNLGTRVVAREVGTALAVLAMYALLLLVPWHQSGALQRDLAKLGYATVGTVDICSPANLKSDDGQQSDALKCHIFGADKFDLAFIEPVSIVLPASRVSQAARFFSADDIAHTALAPHIAQARAPPATV